MGESNLKSNNDNQKQEWQQEVEKTVERFPERKETFETLSNIEVDRMPCKKQRLLWQMG